MILGIDPGMRKLGYALINSDLSIVDAGILLQEKDTRPQQGLNGITKKITDQQSRTEDFERIGNIVIFFEELIKKFSIKTVSMEKLFFTKYNQANAEFVYGVRGALIVLFIRHDIHITEHTPIELKKAITGNGKAEKILVQQFIMKIFKLHNMPQYNDTADALGLAYLGVRVKR